MESNSLDRSPIHLLHRASQCATDLFQRAFGDSELTPRQLAVLMTVAEREGLNQTDIVQATGIDRSTLADVVRRLVKRGWLRQRRTREDARAYAVNLTDEGRLQFRRALPVAAEVDASILGALPRNEGEKFIERLQSVLKALERGDHQTPV